MKKTLLALFVVLLPAASSRAAGERPLGPKDLVVLYEHDNFNGRQLPLEKDTLDLVPLNFNDITTSIKIRNGWQATFYEDTNGKGDYFVLNCPAVPIGIKQSDYCEFKNLASDVATGFLCEVRARGAHGCVPWWNDRVSGVGNIKPADESEPQGRIGSGHAD